MARRRLAPYTIISMTCALAAVATAQAAAPASGGGTSPRRTGAPPAAVAACAGAGAGDACIISGLYGERIAGVCGPVGEQLACIPADRPTTDQR
jgi:hypothetical protein